MISKVKAPPKLTLIRGSQGLKNDPNGGSGGGASYEAPQDKPESIKKAASEDSDSPPAEVSEFEKAGMTDVMMDFYEHKNDEEQPPSPGLTTRYQVDTSPTKGLLLNKKAE